MHNQDRIVELLAEMVYKQDILIDEFREVKDELRGVKDEVRGVKDEVRGIKQELVDVNRRLDEHRDLLKEHSTILREHTNILTNHERLLKRNERQNDRILELLSEDVIRYEEILDVEQLEEGKRIVLHKSKYSSNL